MTGWYKEGSIPSIAAMNKPKQCIWCYGHNTEHTDNYDYEGEIIAGTECKDCRSFVGEDGYPKVFKIPFKNGINLSTPKHKESNWLDPAAVGDIR